MSWAEGQECDWGYNPDNDLPATGEPVSIVIPYKCGTTINPIYPEENDELLTMFGGETIGHGRIAAAERAQNEWLVMTDADATYPEDYIPKVKKLIAKHGRMSPIFSTKRLGGFGNGFWNPYEHGMVVRKDYFLEVCRDYDSYARAKYAYRFPRVDVAPLFQNTGVPICTDITYFHPYTQGEKYGYKASGGLAAAVLAGMVFL